MRLVQADEAERLALDRLTYQAWGTRLDPAQYLEREARLRAHPWSQQALTSWLLLSDGGELLSSCETYRMDSFAAGAPGATFGVASVFTEPRLRGHGHGSQ